MLNIFYYNLLLRNHLTNKGNLTNMYLLLPVAVWNDLQFEKDINAETYIDQYVLKHGLKFPMEIGK